MSATFALGVPHTPWVPARVESLARLLDLLGIERGSDPPLKWSCAKCPSPRKVLADPLKQARIFADREPNYAWSERMWTWGAEQDASHFLTLQDDVKVSPDFWPILRALTDAVPDQVIALEVVHPATHLLASQGHRWFTSPDCIVGVGYVLPIPALKEFLAWRSTALKPGAVERMVAAKIGEDSLLGLWCTVTGRRIWNPIPTIIDHDVDLASTYGHENHGHRRPLVRWDTCELYEDRELNEADLWLPADTPHVGRFPGWALPFLAKREVIGYTDQQFQDAMRDDGQRAIVPLLYRNVSPDGKRWCWLCLANLAQIESHVTGAALCRKCLASTAARLIEGA